MRKSKVEAKIKTFGKLVLPPWTWQPTITLTWWTVFFLQRLRHDECLKRCARQTNDFQYNKVPNFTDMVSDSTLQLTLKKLPFVFWCIKEEYSQLPERLAEHTSLFQSHIYKARFSSDFSQNNILQQTECRRRYENPARH